MPLFGELFLSEAINKPVFDPKGEIIGRVRDIAVRDILDKQIVDANGAKVVRANDIKLEGYDGELIIGMASGTYPCNEQSGG